MTRIITKKLGGLLIENGIITEEQLNEALQRQKKQGGYLGQNLVEMGYTDEKEIVSCLTVQYGYPYLPLRNYEINREIIKLIPVEMAKEYYIIPIDKIGNVLTVTIANPLDEEAVQAIEKATECKVEVFISTNSEIKAALKGYYEVNMHEHEDEKDKKG